MFQHQQQMQFPASPISVNAPAAIMPSPPSHAEAEQVIQQSLPPADKKRKQSVEEELEETKEKLELSRRLLSKERVLKRKLQQYACVRGRMHRVMHKPVDIHPMSYVGSWFNAKAADAKVADAVSTVSLSSFSYGKVQNCSQFEQKLNNFIVPWINASLFSELNLRMPEEGQNGVEILTFGMRGTTDAVLPTLSIGETGSEISSPRLSNLGIALKRSSFRDIPGKTWDLVVQFHAGSRTDKCLYEYCADPMKYLLPTEHYWGVGCKECKRIKKFWSTNGFGKIVVELRPKRVLVAKAGAEFCSEKCSRNHFMFQNVEYWEQESRRGCLENEQYNRRFVMKQLLLTIPEEYLELPCAKELTPIVLNQIRMEMYLPVGDPHLALRIQNQDRTLTPYAWKILAMHKESELSRTIWEQIDRKGGVGEPPVRMICSLANAEMEIEVGDGSSSASSQPTHFAFARRDHTC